MKVIQINTVYMKGSTGKIAYQVQQRSLVNGIENIVAYRYAENKHKEKNTYCVSTWFDCHVHNRLARYMKNTGAYSRLCTQRFVRYLKKENPDIVHIHNIHGSFINVPMLFSYLRESKIKTSWTLHDCWSFTGNCPYFDMAKCNKWKEGCVGCEQYKSVINKNQSAKNWTLKKRLYADMDKLILVTPSKWLSDQVKESFLKERDSVIINNGIDLNVFKPVDSDFRLKYKLMDKNIVLGVAFGWGKRKGLDVFIELEKRLDPTLFKIVLVGTDDTADKQLPDNIISIHRTQNQEELAEIYTAADIFVNPTREEMFGLVNIEALACGTPGVTFKTGGSPECYDDTCGSVVNCDDINALEKEIIRICMEKPFSKEACLKKARQYDMNERFKEYVELYKSVLL